MPPYVPLAEWLCDRLQTYLNWFDSSTALQICAYGEIGKRTILKRWYFGLKVRVLLGTPNYGEVVELVYTQVLETCASA